MSVKIETVCTFGDDPTDPIGGGLAVTWGRQKRPTWVDVMADGSIIALRDSSEGQTAVRLVRALSSFLARAATPQGQE